MSLPQMQTKPDWSAGNRLKLKRSPRFLKSLLSYPMNTYKTTQNIAQKANSRSRRNLRNRFPSKSKENENQWNHLWQKLGNLKRLRGDRRTKVEFGAITARHFSSQSRHCEKRSTSLLWIMRADKERKDVNTFLAKNIESVSSTTKVLAWSLLQSRKIKGKERFRLRKPLCTNKNTNRTFFTRTKRWHLGTFSCLQGLLAFLRARGGTPFDGGQCSTVRKRTLF